jgi:MFS family permease
MKAPRRTLHYAWVVLGALVVVMLLGSGLRVVSTFGWDRAALSGAAAISLLLLGAAGPIVGWLADQWGPRRVIFLSAILLGLGAMLSSRVSARWHIYITCGVLMGLGAGGVGMSTGAALAARWFEARRGLVMGLVGARRRPGSS